MISPTTVHVLRGTQQSTNLRCTGARRMYMMYWAAKSGNKDMSLFYHFSRRAVKKTYIYFYIAYSPTSILHTGKVLKVVTAGNL